LPARSRLARRPLACPAAPPPSVVSALSLHDALPILHLAGMLAVAPAELPALLFASWRGWVLAAAVVLLSAAYPFTGFVTRRVEGDRKSTRLNSSHVSISYAVFCLKKRMTEPFRGRSG